MAVTAALYGHFFSNALGGMTEAETPRVFDLLTDSIKVMLCTSTYVPDQDNHKFKSSVTNELPATGGYTAGGVALASKTLVYTAAGHYLVFDAADAIWTTATLSAVRIAVIYNARAAADADKELIGFVDFGSDRSSVGVNFELQWDPLGIFKLAAASPA